MLSGKTGFTGKAGYCYVAALKKEGKAFTVALLGCGWPPHKTYKWADMRKLDQYAFDTYNWYDIFDREKTFPEVEVRRGVKGTTESAIGKTDVSDASARGREARHPL